MGNTNPGHGRRGAPKVKHLGRTKVQIARYYLHTYAQRKIRHMLRANGFFFARAWAQARHCEHLLP